MPFTDNQQKAIDLRERNILVSAAAGSGKTSVLVERIIKRITDEKSPVDIDRLLIMTFTNAAAKEMRDRIRQAIEKQLISKPNDENLIKQSVIIQNAQISTIHGFCQNIIRDHFEEIAIDPTFRVADENECKLLKYDAIDEVLEQFYEEGSKDFLNFVECYSSNKSDGNIAELVLKIYGFAQSNPNPKEYLENLYRPYAAESFDKFSGLEFVKDYIDSGKETIALICASIKESIRIIDSNPAVEPYKKMFESDLKALEIITSADSYDDMLAKIGQVEFVRMASIKDSSISFDDIIVRDNLKKVREDYKAQVKKIQSKFALSLEEIYKRMHECVAHVAVLSKLVSAFEASFSERKASKNIIDFNDMEHMAIRILSGNEEIARSYREQFVEIYVDEYQDSNLTQEALINLIKREEPNGNLFMVGDVKQSIYRFRQARPDLFIEKYDSYKSTDDANQKVVLNDNFRSRREVIDAVNEIFAYIMKKECGGIEYDDDASLKYGAKYYDEADEAYLQKREEENKENNLYKAEFVVCKKGELGRLEMEAEYISARIKQLIEDKTPVFDKDKGIIRAATYKDIVILARSLNGFDGVLKKSLDDNDIPVSITSREGYFGVYEVEIALAFLKVIDNPLQDIALAAYVKSPVIGMTDKELAIIRVLKDESIKGKKILLYDSIKEHAKCTSENGEEIRIANKCQKILDSIEYYRNKATYTPVSGILREFIDNEYGHFVRGMDRPMQRVANLEALVVKATEYGRSSFSGLFNFVRYMELIKKYKIEDGETSILGDDNDVVRVMTIHKSKGLEFPICFVVGMEKKRNTSDERGAVVLDADYGIGMEYVDSKKRIKSKTLYKNVIADRIKLESIAEEIRVLYVALTRAREKLIMVGYSDKDEELETSKSDIMSVSSYQDMVALARKLKGELVHVDVISVSEEDLVVQKVASEMGKEVLRDEILSVIRSQDREISEASVVEPFLVETIYPSKPRYDIPSKLSVSDLKHSDIERKMAEGSDVVEEGKKLFEDTQPDKYIPEFMLEEGKTKSGATFYGTAFHRILELWNYDIIDVKAEDVIRFVNESLVKKMISSEQAEAIRAEDIAFFLNTKLARRIYVAKQNGKLFREQPFMIGLPSEEVAGYLGLKDDIIADEDCNCSSDDLIIIQGIIDAYIVEEDGISIIDYKTDSVSDPKILINRYTSQLEYYRKALEQITGLKVKELVIYSSKLRKEIVI